MSVLSQKLAGAAREFQNHNFRKSLELYQDCLNFCYRTEESDTVVSNVQSAKATVEYVLGDYENALATLNNVLRSDPSHFLCLFRRSQVFKKQGKLRRAMKDLNDIGVYSPDNLQIAAMRAELEQLMIKEKVSAESSSESEEESDEEAQLNFSNLKMIDRKSSDALLGKNRKSRVTILGDVTFEYKVQQEEETAESEADEPINDKAMRTFKEIDCDDDDEENMPSITIKPPNRGKSILKNRGTTSIFVHEETKEVRKSRYLGRESHILEKLKDIDGKLIRSASHEHEDNPSIKEVEFRKSIHNEEDLMPNFASPRAPSSGASGERSPVNLELSTPTLSKRKSCLKRSSFDMPEPVAITKRRSKLEMLSAAKIDGHILGSGSRRKSFQEDKSAEKDSGDKKSESDDSSEHNIFGDNRMVLSTGWEQRMGVESAMERSMPIGNLEKKKSILKKNSMVALDCSRSSILRRSAVESPPVLPAMQSLRSKKSVMFNCTL